eukprot:5859904-Amphidinium_carterae.3
MVVLDIALPAVPPSRVTRNLRVISAHLPHSWNDDESDFDLAFAKLCSAASFPEVVVCADLNTPLYLSAENTLAEQTTPTLGANILPHRFASEVSSERAARIFAWMEHNGFVACSTHGEGPAETWRAWGSVATRRDQIDYILHRGPLCLAEAINSWELSVGSDHSFLSCTFTAPDPSTPLLAPRSPRPPNIMHWCPTDLTAYQRYFSENATHALDLDAWHAQVLEAARMTKAWKGTAPTAGVAELRALLRDLEAQRSAELDPGK